MLSIVSGSFCFLFLLRILSMFFIIGLHLINNGGILANTPVLSVKYFVLVIMLVFFYTSVNIFAMLTGYLSCNKKKIKSVRLIELISIVIFYCVLIFISSYIFDKSIFGDLSVKSFLTNLFPFLFIYDPIKYIIINQNGLYPLLILNKSICGKKI